MKKILIISVILFLFSCKKDDIKFQKQTHSALIGSLVLMTSDTIEIWQTTKFIRVWADYASPKARNLGEIQTNMAGIYIQDTVGKKIALWAHAHAYNRYDTIIIRQGLNFIYYNKK